jgi:3-methyl-2-oxobutanoate hydroxymethyltransferase
MTDVPMTVPRFVERKGGEPLCMLTAYDFPFAKIFDEAGVDALLVGDSLGTVLHGEPHTLGVTMDQMVYHARLVAKATTRALVIADLPFMSYQADPADAVRNAGRLLKEAGVHAVKLEGGARSAHTIAAVVQADIPVMGHIGMTPQSVRAYGGFKVQRGDDRLIEDAKAVEDAGAFGMVLEGIPTETARKITAAVTIPTIGIGAGAGCDGQVLVWSDALGLTTEFQAKFVKRFAEIRKSALDGAKLFCQEVRSRKYPDVEHSYR